MAAQPGQRGRLGGRPGCAPGPTPSWATASRPCAWPNFDRVYAIEAKARALACLDRLDEAGPLRQAAIEAVAQIADEEDRKILEGDVEAPPWFGLSGLSEVGR